MSDNQSTWQSGETPGSEQPPSQSPLQSQSHSQQASRPLTGIPIPDRPEYDNEPEGQVFSNPPSPASTAPSELLTSYDDWVDAAWQGRSFEDERQALDLVDDVVREHYMKSDDEITAIIKDINQRHSIPGGPRTEASARE